MDGVALVNVEQQNGVVQSVEYLDVAHALSGRKLNDKTIEKENRAALSPRSGTKSDSESQFSTISIVDFLGIVNSTHQGFLSDDVVKRLDVERRGPKKGLFSTQETDPISNRYLLANAFEGISRNSVEYGMIQDYKRNIDKLNKLEEQLSDVNRGCQRLRKKAVELKDEHPALAQVLYNISVQEDAHQAALHKEVVKIIEDHRRTHGEPPAAMMAVYEYVHQKHIDDLADARRYQDVYKSS